MKKISATRHRVRAIIVSMNMFVAPPESPDAIAAQLLRLSPLYGRTPLLDLPQLASSLGVAQILAKHEGCRALGSFKSLGGTYAGLRALAKAANTDIDGVLDRSDVARRPMLLTASAGNHGLAVAAAAHFAGSRARIYLYRGVAPARVRRIENEGAEIVWVDGSYDEAVDIAQAAALAGAGILVADTSANAADQGVADIVAGYGVIAAEIRRQVEEAGHLRPTHLFVQAGVGGLATAMALGLKSWMAPPARVVVVEPAEAACIEAAFGAGRPIRIPGNLATCASMLACGEASASAVDALQQVGADVVRISEPVLEEAVRRLRLAKGPATTPSGAAGLAGLMTVMAVPELAARLNLDGQSRSLIIVTETDLAREG